MADPTIDEACIALATVVGSISGLRAKAYPDDQVNPDEAHVYTQPFDPRMVFGKGAAYGASTYLLGVRVFVSANESRTAHKKIRGYMDTTGTSSILAKIEDETTWVEMIHHASVTNIGQPTYVDMVNPAGGSTTYLTVDFDVEVVW